MLVSAAEPILQVTSHSLFAFFFINLIVLMILLGTRFGSTADSRTRHAMPVFDIHHDVKQQEIDVVELFSSDQIVRSSRPEKHGEEKLELGEVTEVCNGEIKREEENEDNITESEEEEDDGEEVDDELRRRIEDFIAKVNREREADNLKERMHQLTLLDSADAPN